MARRVDLHHKDMTMQVFKTEGAPIKSCQGRRVLDFENYERALNKDLHFTWIGEGKVTWNVEHNIQEKWSREESVNHNDDIGLMFDSHINGDMYRKEGPYIREDGTIGKVTAITPKYPVWDKSWHYKHEQEEKEKEARKDVQVGTFEVASIERDYIRLPSMGFEAEYKVEHVPACQIPTNVHECEDGDAIITGSVAYPEPVIEVHDVESSDYVGTGGNCRNGQFHVTTATYSGTANTMTAQTHYIPVGTASTNWSEAYFTTNTTQPNTFVLNFGPCQWPQHEGGDTCPSFRMNPVYSYCPTHMNNWYHKIGCDTVTWHINQDGIAVSQTDEGIRRLSPEAMAERERRYNSPEAVARRERLREEDRKLKEFEKVGELKATELLKSWLSEAEWNYLQEHRELELPSQYEKDTIYIVKRDNWSKVVKRVKGVDTEELCIHTAGHYARDDEILSKVLMIKGQEEEFLKVAVKYPLVRK